MLHPRLRPLFGIVLLIALAAPHTSHAQRADDITGTWLNEAQDAHIQIYRQGNAYYGKIVWMLNPLEDDGTPKVDVNNPDPALRTRRIQGLVILKHFVFDGDDEWEDGTIYNPREGKTYSCYITLERDGRLKVRGYVGISLIGKTQHWTRVR